MMRKLFLFVTACLLTCATQTAAAYEYEFDMSKCKDTRTVTAANHVLYTMAYDNGVTITLDVTPDFNIPNALDRVQVNDENKLVIPALAKIQIKVNDGYYMRMAWLGAITSNYNFGEDEVLAGGVTEANVHDMHNIITGSTSDHLFVAGMNTYATTKVRLSTLTTNNFPKTSGNDQDYYLGPIFRIWSEGTSLEDLVKADNSVREQTHKIDHDLVGVAVKTVNNQQYLMARSVEQLSPKYRQTMRADQESFKDDNGNVYEWSNPNTPQYAWIMLKVNNPGQYVGKTFNNVRGKFCDFVENPYHVFWLNPFMTVSTTPVITGDATDADKFNKYPLANLVLPKDDHYFLLKPSLCEVCDITDVMRSHRDHFIYVPDNNAMMPEEVKKDENGNVIDVVAKPNFYVDNNLSYGQNYSYASFLDNEGVLPYAASDAILLNGQTYSFDWQLYDKVYDFPSSVIVAAHHGDKDEYVYPLEIPNNTYTQSVTRPVINIVGEGELQAYNSDFFVSNQNYWSRYKYKENCNAYRNDISFTYSKPVTSASNKDITLNIFRCNDKGERLAKVAEVKNNQWDPKKFTVTSTAAAQEAKDEDVLQNLGTAPSFPNGQEFLIGEKDANGNYVTRILLSDMFYSTSMDNAEQNGKLSSDYQYRIEASIDGVTSVVGYAPVYKTNENAVTRATYTQEQVDADVDNTLEENNKAEINFTPNMAKAMTEYRVYKGDDQTGSLFNSVASNDIVLANNFLSEAFEDEIVDGTVYVPELYTEYNANTYGCYKQSVSDASVYMKVHDVMASVVANNGVRYCHAIIDLTSAINNVAKDSRYLLRVWRKVGNNPLVLLNTEKEKTGDDFTGSDGNGGTYDWQTNYSSLEFLGMEADAFAKTNPQDPFILYDTFKVGTVAGAPGMKADNIAVEPITYYATLYVKDDASEKYYVKKIDSEPVTSIPTGISAVNAASQVESVRYYNTIGVESETPFQGMNIVVTRYSNGTTTTTKMIR